MRLSPFAASTVIGVVLALCSPFRLAAQFQEDARIGLEDRREMVTPRCSICAKHWSSAGSYWKEGAVALFVPAAYLAYKYFRDDPNNSVGGSIAGGIVVGAVVGGLLGAAIGRMIPKGEESAQSSKDLANRLLLGPPQLNGDTSRTAGAASLPGSP